LSKPVVDLVGVDEIAALAPADEEPVPLAAGEREAGDAQRLPLRAAGLLHPVVASPRWIDAVARSIPRLPGRPCMRALTFPGRRPRSFR